MPNIFSGNSGLKLMGEKPQILGKIKDWTQDPIKGDKFYTGEGSGQGWYPIWKTESENALTPITDRAQELTDPNSAYYQKIQKQMTSQLTGALSPNSLLALTVAMGGSPGQAREQIKATQEKITDTAGNLMNQYYLSASGQANNLYGMGLQNAQFNQEEQFQLDMYNKQKQDSLLNTILSGTLGIGANLLTGGLYGATKMATQ